MRNREQVIERLVGVVLPELDDFSEDDDMFVLARAIAIAIADDARDNNDLWSGRAPAVPDVIWEVARMLCEWERGDESATEFAARLAAFLTVQEAAE